MVNKKKTNLDADAYSIRMNVRNLNGRRILRIFAALSEHYFSLYPEDMQQLRIQFKPGLVPPYYADMPKTFDEIIDSERQYLLAKEKHPFSTDVRYFFKAWYNILIKRARSQ